MTMRGIEAMRVEVRRGTILCLGLIAVLVLSACNGLLPSLREPEGPALVTRVDDQGYTAVDLGALAGALGELKAGELDEPELEAILYLREGEKLARELFLILDEQWGESTFALAATAEDTHTEALKALIDRYELWDPMSVTSGGEYVNEELYELHHKLAGQGRDSLVEALKVGVEIEEISILDLREYVAETDDADVQMVYENLLRASRNHLRVFSARLQEEGETVDNSYLSQALFDEITGTPPEPGLEQQEAGE
jgi:hypothetical protein